MREGFSGSLYVWEESQIFRICPRVLTIGWVIMEENLRFLFGLLVSLWTIWLGVRFGFGV